MSEAAPRVQRPALLGLVAAMTFAAMLASLWGLLSLDASRQAGPISLTTRSDEIADALGDSPWIGSDATGPIVWSVVKPERGCCWDVTPAALVGLSEENVEARVIVVAPRTGASAQGHADAAQFAQDRDWAAFQVWSRDDAQITGGGDPTVMEGYAEWGRASYDRIAAILRDNGVEPRLPMVIWRVGSEWRVLVGNPNARLDSVRRDLSVES